jgi:hypothetical protein
MKTIVKTYALAAAVLAVATVSFVAASPKAGRHQQSAIRALAYDCCDNPSPCGVPGTPPCPYDTDSMPMIPGFPTGTATVAPTN